MAHGGKQIKMKKLRVKKWRVKKWVLKALKATKRALKTTMTQAMAMRFELMCLVLAAGHKTTLRDVGQKFFRLEAIRVARVSRSYDPIRDIEKMSDDGRLALADMRLQWDAFAAWLADGPGQAEKEQAEKENAKNFLPMRPIGQNFNTFLTVARASGKNFRVEFGRRYLQFKKLQARH